MTFEKFLLAVVEATKPNQSLYTQIGKLRDRLEPSPYKAQVGGSSPSAPTKKV